MDADQLQFTACYDETAVELAGAVQLEDLAGHASNAVCFTGEAW